MSDEEGQGGARINALSEQMLEAADALTLVATRLAGIPEAHYVNMAGRNRMLSQRIVKLFLFQDLADCAEAAQAQIDVSAAAFDANLDELRHSAGSLPQLVAQLEEVAQQWGRLKTAMVPSAQRLRRSQHLRLVVAKGGRLLRHVDTAVKLYERLTHQP